MTNKLQIEKILAINNLDIQEKFKNTFYRLIIMCLFKRKWNRKGKNLTFLPFEHLSVQLI